jgi:hypothetical protein
MFQLPEVVLGWFIDMPIDWVDRFSIAIVSSLHTKLIDESAIKTKKQYAPIRGFNRTPHVEMNKESC